jgi:hypothetical protein
MALSSLWKFLEPKILKTQKINSKVPLEKKVGISTEGYFWSQELNNIGRNTTLVKCLYTNKHIKRWKKPIF